MAPLPSSSADLTTSLTAAADSAPPSLGSHPAIVLRLRGETRVLDLGKGRTLAVGRAIDNDVVVDDTSISRKHARLESRADGLYVVDCGSRNGVAVGGRRVRSEERVVAGDVVTMGPLEILVAGTAPGRSLAGDAREAELPRGAVDRRAAGEDVIVADPNMVELYRTVRRLASLDTTVLVTGETGAGKEVVAQQLHALGPRSRGELVSINAAALPESLLEAELFGHERGAFTGADRKRPGVFLRAHGGTLFLDEIGEMPLTVQAKLLRVLETRRVLPLGASQEIEVDVRIIAATHRDLRAEVTAGRFREDLLFRVAGFTLVVPPLRERPAEIALLASQIAARLASRHGLSRVEIAPATFDELRRRRWAGNVRELKNAIEHAFVLAEDGVIRPEHLPANVGGPGVSGPPSASPPSVRPPLGNAIRDQVASAERAAIEAALRETGGNQSAAARLLSISRRALLYKMERHGIKVRRDVE